MAHRESVDRVGQYLREKGFPTSLYHGGQDQEVRERSLYRFRSAQLCDGQLLIWQLVDWIFPKYVPLSIIICLWTTATFAHRSGRTARWDAEGTAYLLVGPEERLPSFIEADESYSVSEVSIKAQPSQWAVLYIGRGKKDKLSKADILGFLCKKGGLTSAQIGRIDVNPHVSYVAVQRNALKRLLQQVSGEKIKGMKTLIEEMRAN